MASIPSINSPTTNFWNFSLRYYKHSNSAAILLGLQNKKGLDVNLILFSLWVGRMEGFLLLTEHFKKLDVSIESWRDNVVQPLRTSRLFTKALSEFSPLIPVDFLNMAADLELESERICQALLCHEYLKLKDLPKCPNKKSAAFGNLNTYFSFSAIPDTNEIINIKNRLIGFTDEITLS